MKQWSLLLTVLTLTIIVELELLLDMFPYSNGYNWEPMVVGYTSSYGIYRVVYCILYC